MLLLIMILLIMLYHKNQKIKKGVIRIVKQEDKKIYSSMVEHSLMQ